VGVPLAPVGDARATRALDASMGRRDCTTWAGAQRRCNEAHLHPGRIAQRGRQRFGSGGSIDACAARESRAWHPQPPFVRA